MKRSVLLGLLALAAALVVAGWVLLDRGGTQGAGVEEPDATGPDRAPEFRQRPTSPMASGAAESQPIVTKSYAAAEAGAPDEPVPLRVLVVDGAGYPVAGAEVAWQHQRDGDVL